MSDRNSRRISSAIKSGSVRGARAVVRRATELANSAESVSEPDLSDVRSMFVWLRARHRAQGEPWRAPYAWSLISAARTARALGYQEISALEFGVAGGNGLVAMEAAGRSVESLLGVRIAVFGFDTGSGLPPPTDPRDLPFLLEEGDFAMDEQKLRARLQTAELVLGDVAVTAPEFAVAKHPPIGFVSIDLDYYSSTMAAFSVLEAQSARLLPRIVCYFDDLFYPPWSEFDGEAAAIREFNEVHEHRKLAKLNGLRYSLPRSEFKAPWPDLVYLAHVFDHERFAEPEGIERHDLSLRL